MSIADIQNCMNKIKTNRQNYAAAVERIRADKTLSEIGRAQKISRTYNEALERHQALVSEFNQAKADTRKVMAQDAFAPSVSSTMNRAEAQAIRDSFTAAIQRADSVKEFKGLQRMIELASVSGDKNTALAAAYIAYERGEYRALEKFGELWPTDGKYIEDLYHFDNAYGAKMDRDAQFTERAQITGPTKPPEYMNAVPREEEAAS